MLSMLSEEEPVELLTETKLLSPSDADEETILVPNVREILAFAIPAIGVWLCSPLLSMIDTSTVGLFAGTAQQAALNPAVAVTDYSARLMSFLYTGTTNMIATAAAQDRGDKSQPVAAKRFQGALRLAALVGSGLGAFIFIFARPMLRGIIGNDDIDPQIFSAAMKYVRIRALGMPAAACIGTAQAACLGMKDIKSPLLVIATAALVNLVMDLALVGRPQAWLGGAAGAAWATLFSQYFAMGMFFKWLLYKPTSSTEVRSGRLASILPSKWLSHRKPKRETFTTRGFLNGRLTWRDFLERPDADTSKLFKPYVIPVTITQVGRCSTYIAMGHTVSSSFGTISMAANQIITSIFYSLIPVADSLSQTAQSFLPGIVARKPSHEKTQALRRTILNLLKVAGLFGLFLAGVVACIPLTSTLFTTDSAVVALVCSIVPVLFVIFSLHGVFCGSEGILLAQRDLKFLGRMYTVFFAVVPYLMLRIKNAAKLGAAVDLRSVWNLFLGYQLFRIIAWVSRVAWLQHRETKKSEAAASL
jgi:Na+-driven multidrug efflux pump